MGSLVGSIPPFMLSNVVARRSKHCLSPLREASWRPLPPGLCPEPFLKQALFITAPRGSVRPSSESLTLSVVLGTLTFPLYLFLGISCIPSRVTYHPNIIQGPLAFQEKTWKTCPQSFVVGLGEVGDLCQVGQYLLCLPQGAVVWSTSDKVCDNMLKMVWIFHY